MERRKEKEKSLGGYMLKEIPGREDCYDDSRGSSLLFQARVGALPTEDRLMKVFTKIDNGCKLCNDKEAEDISHILLKCKGLQDNKWIKLLRENNTTVNEALGLEKSNTHWDIEITKNILAHWEKKKEEKCNKQQQK